MAQLQVTMAYPESKTSPCQPCHTRPDHGHLFVQSSESASLEAYSGIFLELWSFSMHPAVSICKNSVCLFATQEIVGISPMNLVVEHMQVIHSSLDMRLRRRTLNCPFKRQSSKSTFSCRFETVQKAYAKPYNEGINLLLSLLNYQTWHWKLRLFAWLPWRRRIVPAL